MDRSFLSYLILSYLILSYLVLSYLILSYLILSYLILSYTVYVFFLFLIIDFYLFYNILRSEGWVWEENLYHTVFLSLSTCNLFIFCTSTIVSSMTYWYSHFPSICFFINEKRTLWSTTYMMTKKFVTYY